MASPGSSGSLHVLVVLFLSAVAVVPREKGVCKVTLDSDPNDTVADHYPADCRGNVWPTFTDCHCDETHYRLKFDNPRTQYWYTIHAVPKEKNVKNGDVRDWQCVAGTEPEVTIAINERSLIEDIRIEAFDKDPCMSRDGYRDVHGYCFYLVNVTGCVRQETIPVSPTNNTPYVLSGTNDSEPQPQFNTIAIAAAGLIVIGALCVGVYVWCKRNKRRAERVAKTYIVYDRDHRCQASALSEYLEVELIPLNKVPWYEFIFPKCAWSRSTVFIVLAPDVSAELKNRSKLSAWFKNILVRILTKLPCFKREVNLYQDCLCLLDTTSLHCKNIVVGLRSVETPVVQAGARVIGLISSFPAITWLRPEDMPKIVEAAKNIRSRSNGYDDESQDFTSESRLLLESDGGSLQMEPESYEI